MTKLAQTLGLTEFQTEIIATVRQFVEKEVIPNAPELERTDTYPQAIVDQMREMGLFGLMIPEEYGYSKEYEIERLMRDAPFLLIGEGTSEIQKNIISKRLLADYRI
jgi:alkylation response protein AidB-like acyl-CoA dehydrogenase